MIPTRVQVLLLALGMICTIAPACGAELQAFTYFRSDRGLQTGDAALPENLDAPEALRWQVPLDSGHSTPVLVKGRIYLTTFRADSRELAVMALEQDTGRTLWRQAIVPEKIEQTHTLGNPATATPACDGERLFVFFGSAGLFCYDLSGKKLWEQKMGPFRDEYGAGSSPILFEDRLILNQDPTLKVFWPPTTERPVVSSGEARVPTQ